MEGPSLMQVSEVLDSLSESWDLAMADTTSAIAAGRTQGQIAAMLAIGCHAHETANCCSQPFKGNCA
jgi:hypothetical protein